MIVVQEKDEHAIRVEYSTDNDDKQQPVEQQQLNVDAILPRLEAQEKPYSVDYDTIQNDGGQQLQVLDKK